MTLSKKDQITYLSSDEFLHKYFLKIDFDESAALPAELIPQNGIFYSICGCCRGSRAGDFGGGEIGVCKKSPTKLLGFFNSINLEIRQVKSQHQLHVSRHSYIQYQL